MDNTYFTISGGDGTGKSTVVNELQSYLESVNTFIFFEPGGNETSKLIRESILVDNLKESKNKLLLALKNKTISQETRKLLEIAKVHFDNEDIGLFETYMYAASRSETNEKVVKEKLKEQNVFGTRSISCSMAYQGGGRGIPIKEIEKANSFFDLILPKFEIHLTIPIDIAQSRINGRTGKIDRLDKEDINFHKRVNQAYLDYFNNCPYDVFFVDASSSIEEVVKTTKEIIDKQIFKNKTPNF